MLKVNGINIHKEIPRSSDFGEFEQEGTVQMPLLITPAETAERQKWKSLKF